MTPVPPSHERWKRIDALLEAALDLPADARAAFLTQACGGDESLRREVESLLRADGASESLLDRPVASLAGRAFAQARERQLIGREIGPYKILSRIGAGGMGEVYLAQDGRLGRKVALKFLPPHFTSDAERLRRFEQEGRAASALNHPNIVTVYEIGRATLSTSAGEEDACYIVTEYIEGQTLRQRLAAGPMTPRDAVDAALQAASALVAAHAAGIVHRDIKPENLMVRPDGYVKVLDFGLAKLLERNLWDAGARPNDAVTMETTVPGRVLGTLRYMSPEQARGLKVDARTDLFSLGVVLYEMLSGQSPFAGETTADVIAAVLERDPPPLSRGLSGAPAELWRVLARAMRKDRDERYQTSEELLADLRELRRELDRGASAARTTSRAMRMPAISRRKLGWGLALAALLAIVLGAGGRWRASFSRTAAPPADRVQVLLVEFADQTGDSGLGRMLRQGLAARLQQFPYLQLYPDGSVRDTLRLMVREPNETVTEEIGREICERRGLRALIGGAVTPLGQHYVLTLNALGVQRGESLARVQIEIETKEQALKALNEAADTLRERLAAPLQALPRFPSLKEFTSSSTEALRSYTQGVVLAQEGKEFEADSFFKRALELDSRFASAWMSRAVVCNNTSQSGCAAEYAAKAFSLRDRTNDHERLAIMAFYYKYTTGEREKLIEVLKLTARQFPTLAAPFVNLCGTYQSLGQNEPAYAAAREAVRLAPNGAPANANLAVSALRSGRVEESRAVLAHMMNVGIDDTFSHMLLFQLACLTNDEAGRQREVDRLIGQADEYQALDWQAQYAAFQGRQAQMREYTRQALALAARQHHPGAAAVIAAIAALNSSAMRPLDRREPARDILALVQEALGLERSRDVYMPAGLALAVSDATPQATALQAEMARRYPLDTRINAVSLPLQRAALALRKGQAAQALEHLRSVEHYEANADFWPQYLRGLAYLQLRAGREASVEFRKIMDHRPQSPLSPLWPLAHLGQARAAALEGDAARVRAAYDAFFTLWRDADPDLPILLQARQEAGVR